MNQYRAFTLKARGLLNSLPTQALIISEIRDKKFNPIPKMWNAIWDTGASKSCISKRVVDYLHLIPVGKSSISTANGLADTNTYFVNIGLPNSVMIPNIIVSCADLGNSLDILIGMDIITYGDFSITNYNGRTTFSFRIPSVNEVDFVSEFQFNKKSSNS